MKNSIFYFLTISFVLNIQNENEINIYKNMQIEKLIGELVYRFLLIVGALFVVLFYMDDVELYIKQIIIIVLVLLIIISIIGNQYLINYLQSDKKNKLNQLQISQLIKLIILSVFIIYESTSISLKSNLNLNNLFQFLSENIVLCPVADYFISTYAKAQYLIALEVQNIIMTIKYLNTNLEQSYVFIFVHVQLLHQIFQSIVQQNLLFNKFKEKSEKNILNFESMHDLRNQIYSLDQIDEFEGDNHYSQTKENILSEKLNILQSDPNKLNVECECEKKNSTDSIQSNINNELIYDDNSKNERKNHMKFIIQKVCFLYHLELVQNQNQIIKPIFNNILYCIKELKDLMRILFMQKNIKINLELNSKIKQIKIDNIIFQYLIIHIAKIFNDYFQDQVRIEINSFDIDPQTTELQLIIKNKDIKDNLIQELNQNSVISKLTSNLSDDITYQTKQDEKSFSIIINLNKKANENKKQINNDTENINEMINETNDNLQIYKTKMSVKDNDKSLLKGEQILKHRNSILIEDDITNLNNNFNAISNINSENSIEGRDSEVHNESKAVIFQQQIEGESNHPYELDENNLIQLNCDDEENILRMNQRLFKKELINLNILRDRGQMLTVMSSIQRDYRGCREDMKPKILVLMDHMLDRDQGQKIIKDVQDMNLIMKLDIKFILVSSSEDKETLGHYDELGLVDFVVKPLTKSKIKDIIKAFTLTNINQETQTL